MNLHQIQMENCKNSKLQMSEYSTSCTSPDVTTKINRKLNSIDFPSESRRFSLPLSKIIHIERNSPNKFEQVIAGNKLKVDDELNFKSEFKPIMKRSVCMQHSFLIEDFNSLRLKRFTTVITKSKPKYWKNNSRNHKPSRFAPLSDMKSNFQSPKAKPNKKVFQVNLNLLLKEKYEKFKADYQFKELISNRSRLSQNQATKNI